MLLKGKGVNNEKGLKGEWGREKLESRAINGRMRRRGERGGSTNNRLTPQPVKRNEHG